MEPDLENRKHYDSEFVLDVRPGFDKSIKFPKATLDDFARVMSDLMSQSKPDGELEYSDDGETQTFRLKRIHKLGLVSKDVEGHPHIAIFPNAMSIDLPSKPTLSDRLSIKFKSNSETKYLHILIGGFRGIFFED
jgi:hypothetical protein